MAANLLLPSLPPASSPAVWPSLLHLPGELTVLFYHRQQRSGHSGHDGSSKLQAEPTVPTQIAFVLITLYTWRSRHSEDEQPHFKKWAKGLDKHLTKEDTWMANKYMKKCSRSLVIKEMWRKNLMRHHCPPTGIITLKDCPPQAFGTFIYRQWESNRVWPLPKPVLTVFLKSYWQGHLGGSVD